MLVEIQRRNREDKLKRQQEHTGTAVVPFVEPAEDKDEDTTQTSILETDKKIKKKRIPATGSKKDENLTDYSKVFNIYPIVLPLGL